MADGSQATIVPANRAMTWQLTDAAGASVVRERYWVTFQPGEVRVCGSCHGVNQYDQAGHVPPTEVDMRLGDGRAEIRIGERVVDRAGVLVEIETKRRLTIRQDRPGRRREQPSHLRGRRGAVVGIG